MSSPLKRLISSPQWMSWDDNQRLVALDEAAKVYGVPQERIPVFQDEVMRNWSQGFDPDLHLEMIREEAGVSPEMQRVGQVMAEIGGNPEERQMLAQAADMQQYDEAASRAMTTAAMTIPGLAEGMQRLPGLVGLRAVPPRAIEFGTQAVGGMGEIAGDVLEAIASSQEQSRAGQEPSKMPERIRAVEKALTDQVKQVYGLGEAIARKSDTGVTARTLDDVKDLESAADWAAGTLTNAGVTMAPTVAAFMAGGPAAGLAMAGLLEGGGTSREVREATGERKPSVTLPAAAVGGALEAAIPGESIEGAAKQFIRNRLKTIAARGAEETGTELLQELTAIGARMAAGGEAPTREELITRLREAGAQGLVGGAGLSIATGEALQPVRSEVEAFNKEITDRILKQQEAAKGLLAEPAEDVGSLPGVPIPTNEEILSARAASAPEYLTDEETAMWAEDRLPVELADELAQRTGKTPDEVKADFAAADREAGRMLGLEAQVSSEVRARQSAPGAAKPGQLSDAVDVLRSRMFEAADREQDQDLSAKYRRAAETVRPVTPSTFRERMFHRWMSELGTELVMFEVEDGTEVPYRGLTVDRGIVLVHAPSLNGSEGEVAQNRALGALVLHEMPHQLRDQNPKAWAELGQLLQREFPGAWSRIEELVKQHEDYKHLKGDDLTDEIIANTLEGIALSERLDFRRFWSVLMSPEKGREFAREGARLQRSAEAGVYGRLKDWIRDLFIKMKRKIGFKGGKTTDEMLDEMVARDPILQIAEAFNAVRGAPRAEWAPGLAEGQERQETPAEPPPAPVSEEAAEEPEAKAPKRPPKGRQTKVPDAFGRGTTKTVAEQWALDEAPAEDAFRESWDDYVAQIEGALQDIEILARKGEVSDERLAGHKADRRWLRSELKWARHMRDQAEPEDVRAESGRPLQMELEFVEREQRLSRPAVRTQEIQDTEVRQIYDREIPERERTQLTAMANRIDRLRRRGRHEEADRLDAMLEERMEALEGRLAEATVEGNQRDEDYYRREAPEAGIGMTGTATNPLGVEQTTEHAASDLEGLLSTSYAGYIEGRIRSLDDLADNIRGNLETAAMTFGENRQMVERDLKRIRGASRTELINMAEDAYKQRRKVRERYRMARPSVRNLTEPQEILTEDVPTPRRKRQGDRMIQPTYIGIPSEHLVKLKGHKPRSTLPGIQFEINERNASEQLDAMDAIAERHPLPYHDVGTALAFERDLYRSRLVLKPPHPLIQRLSNLSRLTKWFSKLQPEQIEAARRGFELTQRIGELYESGKADQMLTGKVMFWSFMSRSTSAAPQESAFIDGLHAGITEWIGRAIERPWTPVDSEQYLAWASSVLPPGSPGRAATDNLNQFGVRFLYRMSQRGPDGMSKLARLHELMSDRSLSSREVRRQFNVLNNDVGVQNKVFSFAMLAAGRPDVIVMDRIQITGFWGEGPKFYTDLAPHFNGAKGAARYEALERSWDPLVVPLYEAVGRADDASLSRLHWETWVLQSGQVVGHPTLESVIDEKVEGRAPTEGRYHTYGYGMQRLVDPATGDQFVRYHGPGGMVAEMSMESWEDFQSRIKRPATGVIRKGFRVTDARKANKPWWELGGANEDRLEALAREHADRGLGRGPAPPGAGQEPGPAAPPRRGRKRDVRAGEPEEAGRRDRRRGRPAVRAALTRKVGEKPHQAEHMPDTKLFKIAVNDARVTVMEIADDVGIMYPAHDIERAVNRQAMAYFTRWTGRTPGRTAVGRLKWAQIPGTRSRLVEAVDRITLSNKVRRPPDIVKKYLMRYGATEEEIEFSGLMDWLKENGGATKWELERFIENNGVTLAEEVLGDEDYPKLDELITESRLIEEKLWAALGPNDADIYEGLEYMGDHYPFGSHYGTWLNDIPNSVLGAYVMQWEHDTGQDAYEGEGGAEEVFDELSELPAVERARESFMQYSDMAAEAGGIIYALETGEYVTESDTKHETVRTGIPGTNYREIVFYLPQMLSKDQVRELPIDPEGRLLKTHAQMQLGHYHSMHYGAGNLGWMRVEDREIPGMEDIRAIFMDEAQSDLHQTAASEGYIRANPPTGEQREELLREEDGLLAELELINKKMNDLRDKKHSIVGVEWQKMWKEVLEKDLLSAAEEGGTRNQYSLGAYRGLTRPDQKILDGKPDSAMLLYFARNDYDKVRSRHYTLKSEAFDHNGDPTPNHEQYMMWLKTPAGRFATAVDDWVRDVFSKELDPLSDKYNEGQSRLESVREDLAGTGPKVATRYGPREDDFGNPTDPVPYAPWGDSRWIPLFAKRLLRRAVDEGYNMIIWPKGRLHAERWTSRLRDVVDRIEWGPGKWAGWSDETKRVAKKLPDVKGPFREVALYKNDVKVTDMIVDAGTGIILESLQSRGTLKKVKRVFPGPMADQILNNPEGKIEGDDIVIGGKLYEHIYDSVWVNTLSGLHKKFGDPGRFNGYRGDLRVVLGERHSKRARALQEDPKMEPSQDPGSYAELPPSSEDGGYTADDARWEGHQLYIEIMEDIELPTSGQEAEVRPWGSLAYETGLSPANKGLLPPKVWQRFGYDRDYTSAYRKRSDIEFDGMYNLVKATQTDATAKDYDAHTFKKGKIYILRNNEAYLPSEILDLAEKGKVRILRKIGERPSYTDPSGRTQVHAFFIDSKIADAAREDQFDRFAVRTLGEGEDVAARDIDEQDQVLLLQPGAAWDVNYSRMIDRWLNAAPGAERFWFGFRKGLQDRMLRVKQLQAELERQVGPIPDSANVYLLEEQMYGKVQEVLRSTASKFFDPINRAMRRHGFDDPKVVDGFLTARHALERNRQTYLINVVRTLDRLSEKANEQTGQAYEATMAQIRKIEDNIARGRIPGSGVSDLDAILTLQSAVDAGLVEVDLEAFVRAYGYESLEQALSPETTHTERYDIMREWLRNRTQPTVQFTGPLAEVAELFDKLNEEKLRLAVQYGLEEKDAVEAMRETYRYYAPMKGIDEEGDLETLLEGEKKGVGRFLDIRGKEIRRALGRYSNPQNPTLAQAMQDFHRVIIRGEKNVVGNAFLRIAQENPNPDLWEINRVRNKKLYDAKKGEVVTISDYLDRLRPEVFATKVKGETVFIHIKDARLATAMKNLGPQNLGVFIQAHANAQRFLASMATSRNPEFIFSNLIRDLQTAGINISELDKDAWKELFNLRSSLAAIAEVEFEEQSERQGGVSRRTSLLTAGAARRVGNQQRMELYKRMYREFREAGGKTGWAELQDLEDYVRELHRALSGGPGVRSAGRAVARAGQQARGAAEAALRRSPGEALSRGALAVSGTGEAIGLAAAPILDFVEGLNTVAENASRLMAYTYARQQGMSKLKAASVARNLTVNFNRRGSWKWFSALYMFGNASIQGTARLFQAATKSKRVQALMAGTAGLGYALALWNRLILGEDDDGEDKWDKIAAFRKERTLMIAVPGTDDEFITIPLPYGYNVAFVAGQVFEQITWSPRDVGRKTTEGAVDLMGAVVGAFNPLGGTFDSGKMVVRNFIPTVFKIPSDLLLNTTFYGAPLARESYDRSTPGYELARPHTPGSFVWAAKTIDRLTGGDEFGIERGLISPKPEQLRYLLESIFGGVGRTATRTGVTLTSLAKGEIPEIREVPYLRLFHSKYDETMDTDLFYVAVERVERARRKERKYEEEKDYAKLKGVREDYGPLLTDEVWEAKKQAEKDLRKARERNDREAMNRIMNRFLLVYNRAEQRR